MTNGFSFPLDRLVVRDGKRNDWMAERVEPGATVMLEPADTGLLGEILDHQVLPPSGEVPMLKSNRRRWGPGTGDQIGVLERRLESWSGRQPPMTFVASRFGSHRSGVSRRNWTPC